MFELELELLVLLLHVLEGIGSSCDRAVDLKKRLDFNLFFQRLNFTCHADGAFFTLARIIFWFTAGGGILRLITIKHHGRIVRLQLMSSPRWDVCLR